jgi:hypothetical protein
MSDKAILGGSLIVAASVVLAGWIMRPLPPGPHAEDTLQTQAPKQRRDALIESFKQQVRQKTPSLNIPADGEITDVQVDDAILANNALNIQCRITFSKDHGELVNGCVLAADGFGGYSGNFSPVSDNSKEIHLYLP